MRELYQYRDLIRALIVRDLTVRYRRSAIGFLWTMLHPLMMMLVLEVVFSTLFRFAVKDYPVYVFSGLLFWNFFSQSLVSSMNSLKGNAALLQKLPVPKAVFPVATVLSGVVNLAFAMAPLMVLLFVTHHGLCGTMVFLPISIVIAAFFTLGIGLLLSPLAVFFSDVVEMVAVFLTVIMYLTPIIYPISIVPARFRAIVELNPLEMLLRIFRDPIYSCQMPGPRSLVYAVVATAIALICGVAVFQRSAERIPYYL